MENLEFETSKQSDWVVVAVKGRLDRLNAAETSVEWEKLQEENSKMVLELSEMEYLSSAGIRVLLRLSKKAAAAGKEFALCCRQGFVKEVLEDSNLDMLVKVYVNLDELP